MPTKKTKETFEQSMERLQGASARMRDGNLTLDQAIQCYEEGMEAHKACLEILETAKQKIIYFQGEGEEETDEIL